VGFQWSPADSKDGASHDPTACRCIEYSCLGRPFRIPCTAMPLSAEIRERVPSSRPAVSRTTAVALGDALPAGAVPVPGAALVSAAVPAPGASRAASPHVADASARSTKRAAADGRIRMLILG